MLWRAVTYPFRRFFWVFASPKPACSARWCARPIEGHIVWCSGHRDRILKGTSNEEVDRWLSGKEI
jgi:hypothetical protein